MAEFTKHIPEAVANVEELAGLLEFWNEEICKKEMKGKSFIFSVLLGTEGEDAGRNLVWFKDTNTEPKAPSKLQEFPITLSDEDRRKAVLDFETANKLEVRSSAIVLLGGEKKWVALFDPAPTQKSPEPPTGDNPPAFVPAAKGASGQIKLGLLESAKQSPIDGGSEMVPLFVVIHYTEGFKADSSVSGWKEKNDGILAHVVVDRDGKIIQCRPFNRSCGHAGGKGLARWQDPRTGEPHNGVNSISIGIEIANTGMNTKLHPKLGTGGAFPDGTTTNAKHRNGSRGSDEARDGKVWEVYPQAQLQAVFDLVSLLVAEYDLHDITGHDCISPERKADPGPAFPMFELRKANGFSGLPKVWDSNGNQIPV